jgi:hypothetical protein
MMDRTAEAESISDPTNELYQNLIGPGFLRPVLRVRLVAPRGIC